MALQSDGKIVAVGGAGVTRPSDFGLARYNPNGSLDPSFSGDGKQTTPLRAPRCWQLRWRSRATARSSWRARPGPHDFALARYNPDGSLDTSFSGDGRQTTDFGGDDAGDRGGDPARRQDRRGRREAGNDFALARYNANGSLDPSFSGDGKQTTNSRPRRPATGWWSKPTAGSSQRHLQRR